MTGLGGTVAGYPLLSDATALIAAGKSDEAADRVMAHLRQYPGEPRGLALLGQIAYEMGALQQAEHFLRHAITRGTRDIEVRRQLAMTVNLQNRLEEARLMFAQLIIESDEPSLHVIHATILDKLGRSEDAIAIFERLSREYPENVRYRIHYGYALRAAGRVDEAIAAFRAVTVQDFEYGEGWLALADIKRKVFDDQDVAEMKRAIDFAIDVRNTAPLHFAMARALHDRGQFPEAFHHYDEGNRQRAESINYDPTELTAEIDDIQQGFDSAYFAATNDTPVGEGVPIFIVSLPRSGSTLLEQMLGSHMSIEPVGELPYVPAILRSTIEMATRRGAITVPQLVASLTSEQAASLGREYFRQADVHRLTDRPYFVDKLPHNWGNIPFLRKILPQARFLDIRRNPMDCCFSNFTQSFSNAHASSFALDHIGRTYTDYVRLMRHLDRVAPGLVHHIHYETLIDDPEPAMRAALDYLGLDWDPAILEFHKLARVVRTPSSEQVRRPLNRDGVGTWQPYDQWLGPLRGALGDLTQSYFD